MAEFLRQLPLFSLVLTVGAYQIGLFCRKKWSNPICSPILIAMLLVVGTLLLTGISAEEYQQGMTFVSWMLTPATVCLALPLYEHLKLLKKNLPAILCGVVAGALTALISVFLICRIFVVDAQVTVSLLPKSITTAIGIVLSEENGGLPALTSASIIITGILGSLTGPSLCKLLRLPPIAQGVSMGTAAHVIGTAKAGELGPVQEAVSSLSMAVAGVFTAVVFPLVCTLV